MEKLTQNIGGGLWAHYGAPEDGYIAAVGEVEDVNGVVYEISFHKGRMPAFSSEKYQTLDEIEARMRELQPDMRKWHTSSVTPPQP